MLPLCAGRVGQLLNLSSLDSDGGITHDTARAWLSVLDVGFLTFRLPRYQVNVGKRVVKIPKLYFYDTGLAAALLGIQRFDQVREHPLRGALFENWLVAQSVAMRAHRGRPPASFFCRERNGFEVDLRERSTDTPPLVRPVVYGGDEAQSRNAGQVIPWRAVADQPWW